MHCTQKQLQKHLFAAHPQVRGDRWVSYDDEHSVRLKAEFAFDMKLGGVMVWSVETDDFKVNFIIIIIIIIICICIMIPRDNFNIRIYW